jgi:hypothetical protein
MKKILVLVLLVVLNLNSSIFAHAQSYAKVVDVQILSTVTTVNVGDKVVLMAESAKHGSGFSDRWTNAESNGTYLNEENGIYASSATFTTDKPGVYEVKYYIDMTTGNGDTTFGGSGTCVIEVKGEVKILGAEISDVCMEAVYWPDGRLEGYSAMGNVYIIRSDNTRSLYGTMFFFFEPEELKKDMEVTIEEAGKTYNFTVTVTR